MLGHLEYERAGRGKTYAGGHVVMIHLPNFDAFDLCTARAKRSSAFRSLGARRIAILTEIPKLEDPIPIRFWVPVQHAQSDALLRSLVGRAR